MNNKKIIAMMMTLSMLAAAFAGCLGGDDDDPDPVVEDWTLTPAADVASVFVTSDWDPIIPNLNAGEMCDAILSAMTKTDEREVVVDFTRGYYTSSQGVIGASGSAAITDALDLNMAGTRVAVQSGTTSDLWANDNLPDATIVAYADFPSVTASISNGDADYAMGDSPVLALSGDLMVTFSDETFGIAVDDGDSELLDALNVAITAMIDSGEYDLIFGETFEGAVVLTDDTDANTATSYPMATEGSRLTHVLESGELRFCSDTSYPPFESLDADGNAVGFDVDIGNAIADEIAAHYMNNANPMFVPSVPDVVIKIGFLNDATGPISVYADAFTFAANAAGDMLSMNEGYTFEIVEADSGCSGDTATSAAQTLVDSGVVAVAGAACSGASMAANAVLSAAGIPQVSYASTSPALSDATAYPDFFRVVPSDALQGQALSAVVDASMPADGTVGLIHMTNSYGSGLADAFTENFEAAGHTLCTTIGYEETTTDFSGAVQSMIDSGCTSAVLVSYAADGGMIIDEMNSQSWTGQVYGGDGIAEEGLGVEATSTVNGVIATKPASASTGEVGYVFGLLCSANPDCAGGIYTAEAFDAIVVVALAAFAQMASPGATLSQVIMATGQGLAGASGDISFLANGDVPGAGYCVGDFTEDADGVSFDCNRSWTLADGLSS
jgi:branched-chain amino acid transport system substrate-binding protein